MARLSPDDYHSMASFRHQVRRFLRFSKELVKANGNLNSEQYEALLAIKAFTSSKGLTIGDLSERLQVKHHSTVNIVDRLVARKLVRRNTSPHDRRARHVELTPAGRNLIDRLAAAHREEIRRRSPEMIAVLERLKR